MKKEKNTHKVIQELVPLGIYIITLYLSQIIKQIGYEYLYYIVGAIFLILIFIFWIDQRNKRIRKILNRLQNLETFQKEYSNYIKIDKKFAQFETNLKLLKQKIDLTH